MKSNFAENLKALRKEQHITQEHLAEAMGVSAGAVYKWEQAISTPDIEMMMELASFFGISVDALVGFQMHSGDKDRILEELRHIQMEKSYADCWETVEKWLQRYPNDFRIVYECGVLYNLAGLETEDKNLSLRSITLLNHACTLIKQNQDAAISETEIHRYIAYAYIAIEDLESGITQLKQDNPCGVNDDLIAVYLAPRPEKREEALHYLTISLLRGSTTLLRVTEGFVDVFFQKEDYRSAIDILHGSISFMKGLQTSRGQSYICKSTAILLSILGTAYEYAGDRPQARKYLTAAYQAGMKFDAAPNYTSENIRFCEGQPSRSAYDNGGGTAMESIQRVLEELKKGRDSQILALWEEICNET